MSTVIAVVGTIAGAGTTTVATSLGTALGEQRRRVALVDATEEGSRIEDSIDVTGEGELVDALRRGTTPADVQATGPHDVATFPSTPTTSWGAVRPDAVDTFYEALRERFEFVVVDCGCSVSAARSPWLGHADEVAIVTDPDVAGAVAEPATLASAFDVPIRGVVANRVPHKEVDDALDAMETVDAPVLGVLPEDPTVGAAADAGTSVLRAEPDSPIATCVWKLALRIRETDHEEPVLPPSATVRSSRATEQGQRNEDSQDSKDSKDSDSPPDADDAEPERAEDTEDTDGPAPDAEESESTETDVADAADESPETTAAPSPAEAGFETPEPQPVEPATNATPVEPADDEGEVSEEPDDGSDTPSSQADDSWETPEESDETAPDDAGPPSSATEGSASEPASAAVPEESADEDDDSAELSDDEIEAVFQETMQRVQERREADDDE